MSHVSSAEGRPLDDEDIIRLGTELGLRIKQLHPDFYPGRDTEIMKDLRSQLGMRVVELRFRQEAAPEGTHD